MAKPFLEGKMSKGGQNPPNPSGERPPAPGGSGGAKGERKFKCGVEITPEPGKVTPASVVSCLQCGGILAITDQGAAYAVYVARKQGWQNPGGEWTCPSCLQFDTASR